GAGWRPTRRARRRLRTGAIELRGGSTGTQEKSGRTGPCDREGSPNNRYRLPAARVHRPDAQAEALQVDVLTLVRLAGAAAVEADAQEAPQRQRLAGVVVAVVVGVGLQQPAPGAALAGGVGLLLPPLEHARHGLHRR